MKALIEMHSVENGFIKEMSKETEAGQTIAIFQQALTKGKCDQKLHWKPIEINKSSFEIKSIRKVIYQRLW